MRQETIKVSIQGLGDIWLCEFNLIDKTVKWRDHPFVNDLSEEEKKKIEIRLGCKNTEE